MFTKRITELVSSNVVTKVSSSQPSARSMRPHMICSHFEGAPGPIRPRASLCRSVGGGFEVVDLLIRPVEELATDPVAEFIVYRPRRGFEFRAAFGRQLGQFRSALLDLLDIARFTICGLVALERRDLPGGL